MKRNIIKHHLILLLASLLGAGLSACSTLPDPAQVCTSEWISLRSDRAVDTIERKAERSLSALKKAAQSWQKGKTPNPFQLLALSSSVKSLEKELTGGQGIKDLRTLANTCDDPKIISDAMGGFLRKQGLPSNIINFIENMDIYKKRHRLESLIEGL